MIGKSTSATTTAGPRFSPDPHPGAVRPPVAISRDLGHICLSPTGRLAPGSRLVCRSAAGIMLKRQVSLLSRAGLDTLNAYSHAGGIHPTDSSVDKEIS